MSTKQNLKEISKAICPIRKKVSFQSIFKPLTILIQLLTGVTAFSLVTKKIWKWILIFHRFLIVSMVIYGRYVYMIETTIPEMKQKVKFVHGIYLINNFLYYGIVPVIFFFMSFTKRWELLWSFMEQLAQKLSFDTSSRMKIKATVLFGFLILLMDLSLISYDVYDSPKNRANFNNQTWDKNLNVVVYYVVWFTTDVILVLFFSLTTLASFLLSDMNVRLVNDLLESDQPDRLVVDLRNWRRQHILVVKMIQKISDSFGLLALFFTSFGIIRIALKIYSLLDPLTGIEDATSSIHFWSLFAVDVVHTFAVIFIPSTLRFKANRIKMNLLALSNSFDAKDMLRNIAVWTQVSSAMKQASGKCSAISAAGFFIVNYDIIPALLGVVLTYVTIVYDHKNVDHKKVT